MPRILIDITRLLYRRLVGRLPTGVDRVSLEYLRHYSGSARAVLSLAPFGAVLSRADSALAFEVLLDGRAGAAGLVLRSMPKAVLWGWLNRDVSGCCLFNTGHMGLENGNYAVLLRRWGARPVFVVHDLIPITHPEYCRSGERKRHVTRMRNALSIGCGIITNSQGTLEALRTFSNAAGLSMPPAVVAPLASGLPRLVPGPRPMERPYFVVLGTIEPRKNHWLLLQLWRRLIERLGEAAPRLLVIGQRGWECENVADLLERCEPLRGFVTEHNACSDAELVTFLHHARALLFPSFAEGYGMPMAEALSLGVPVIASELPVFREIAGGVPDYADPLDGRRWLELIGDYTAAHSPMRAAQLKRMLDFRPTTWAQHLDTVDAFIERLDCYG